MAWSRKYNYCRECGTIEKKHYAKGLCKPCYHKYGRNIIKCKNCGEIKPHKGKGLCKNCCQNKYRVNNKERLKQYRKQYYKKNKEYFVQYRQKNQEHIKQQEKQYREDNREYLKEWRKKHYRENKEQEAERMKKWRAENKEHCRQYNKQYHQDNKERIRHRVKQWGKDNPEKKNASSAKRRARKLNASGSYTGEDRKFLFNLANYKCQMLGCIETENLHIDHIVPLSKGGRNDIINLQVLCASCNSSKNDHHNTDYRTPEQIEAIAKYI